MSQDPHSLTEIPLAPSEADPAEANGTPGPEFVFDETVLGQSNSVFEDAQVVAPPSPPAEVSVAESTPRVAPALSRAELSRRERRRRVRLQARKVRRIVRHVEPWSVLKLSFVFYVCLWIILVLAGVMLWSVAVSSGTIENAQDLIADLFALDEFTFNGEKIFRGYALGGLVLVIAGTFFNVLVCVLFNIISDLMGGIRVTVIEEESARFRPPRRRR